MRAFGFVTVAVTCAQTALSGRVHRSSERGNSDKGHLHSQGSDTNGGLLQSRSELRDTFLNSWKELAVLLLPCQSRAFYRCHTGSSFSHRMRTTSMSVALTDRDIMLSNAKTQILQIGALTDRGQRLNKMIAPAYQEKREEMNVLVKQLVTSAQENGQKPTRQLLAGDWELVYSDVELFRSSPFFLAIEKALNESPGIPQLGRWLGATDPERKAEVFFRLHQLQVLSWGLSTVGRISQRLDFEKGMLESSFDTTIFGLTVIPILGWFKLLPTFGGRVVTESDRLTLADDGQLEMELQRTQVITAPGVPRLPLLDGIFMDRWYPVNAVWKLLPWNGGRAPACAMKVEYVDEQMRISRDSGGGLFVYTRPISLAGIA